MGDHKPLNSILSLSIARAESFWTLEGRERPPFKNTGILAVFFCWGITIWISIGIVSLK